MKAFAYFIFAVISGNLVSAVLESSSNSTTVLEGVKPTLFQDSKPEGNQTGMKYDRDGRCIDCGNSGGNHQVIQQCTDCLNKGGVHNNRIYPFRF